MKYTYKHEIFLVDHTYKAKVILGGIWFVFAVAMALFGLFDEDLGIDLGVAFSSFIIGVPSFFLMRWGWKQGKKEYEHWQKERNAFLKNGYKMAGKVISSGGHNYWVSHYDPDFGDSNSSNYFHTRESDWFIEIEFYDTRSNVLIKFNMKNMNKNGKHLIGKAVDVYSLNNHIYIDIPE